MSISNDLLNVHNNLYNGLTEQSELITEISEALVGKIAATNKEEQEKTINTQAYTDTSIVVEPDEGKTLSKVTVNIDVKDEQEKSIEITENGTQTILPDTGKTLSKVTVIANVKGGENVEFLKFKKSLSVYNDDNLTKIDSYAFAGCTSLTSIDLPVCRSIGLFAFADCWSLASVNLPECSSATMWAFSNCTNLSSIYLPKCVNIGTSAFYCCSSLMSIDVPICSNINMCAFLSCSSLTSVNLPMCSNIGMYAFSKCTSLSSLTLGYSSVAKLNNINAFSSTPMSISTLTGSFGSIYVPASLVNAYKSATNWITYSDRITAIVE